MVSWNITPIYSEILGVFCRFLLFWMVYFLVLNFFNSFNLVLLNILNIASIYFILFRFIFPFIVLIHCWLWSIDVMMWSVSSIHIILSVYVDESMIFSCVYVHPRTITRLSTSVVLKSQIGFHIKWHSLLYLLLMRINIFFVWEW